MNNAIGTSVDFPQSCERLHGCRVVEPAVAGVMSLSEQRRQLVEAFQAFNVLSQELSTSYTALQAQVARLNDELDVARAATTRELNEKTRLANRMARLLEALPGGVIVLDADDVIVQSNPTAASYLATTLLGQHWHQVKREQFLPGQSAPGEMQLRNGRILNVSISALTPEPGQIILMQDLTALKQLQIQLDRNRRLVAMGEMTARIAHQVRTPLSAAMLYSNHLLRSDLLPQKRKQFVQRLTDRLHQLDRMVNDMLAFSRGGVSGLTEVTVNDVVEDVAMALQAVLQQYQAELKVQNDAQAVRLRVNVDGVVGALTNLVVNSLEAVGQGAVVWLKTAAVADNTVQFTVRDRGAGIPASVRDRLFEPFVTTKPQGTGLGLSVVRAVVESHGGAIEVDSHPGQGTSFRLELPLMPVAGELASDAGVGIAA